LKNQRLYINLSLGQLNFFLIFCFWEACCRVRIINPDFLDPRKQWFWHELATTTMQLLKSCH